MLCRLIVSIGVSDGILLFKEVLKFRASHTVVISISFCIFLEALSVNSNPVRAASLSEYSLSLTTISMSESVLGLIDGSATLPNTAAASIDSILCAT